MGTISKSKKTPATPTSIEKIELRYMPVSEAVFFDLNPKKHDIGSIAESIQRYGFRNPPIWDDKLNDGKGGIVAGNGRTETLRAMELQNQPVPRGIAIGENGQWLMPIIFGCDAESETLAMSYAIDDNNLLFSSGDFTHWDMAKAWNFDEYLSLLTSISEEGVTPVTVDESAISSLLLGLDSEIDSQSFGGDDRENEEKSDRLVCCPNCKHEFKP